MTVVVNFVLIFGRTARYSSEFLVSRYGRSTVFCRRQYSSRGLRRNPIKVHASDNQMGARVLDASERPPKFPVVKPKLQKQHYIFNEEVCETKEREQEFTADSSQDTINLPPYVKLGDDTKLLSSIITLTKSRNHREKKGKILLEGKRLIKDALEAGIELDSLYFSRPESVVGLPLDHISNLKLYKVTYKNLKIWSDLTTSPGIMGIFQRPDYDKLQLKEKPAIPLTILCDNIRLPGNLGAILRCAAAVGCKQIILSKGCVDMWEPKVLRSAAGAHFHVKIINNVGWEMMCNYISEEATVFLASSESTTTSEEHPTEVKGDTSTPHPSLLEKRRWYEVTEDEKLIDPSFLNNRRLKAFKSLPLTTVPYFEANFNRSNNDIILIVGGETDGLSAPAYKFANNMGGQLVHIPLKNGVESLNSAVALGIIIFEIQRQLLLA